MESPILEFQVDPASRRPAIRRAPSTAIVGVARSPKASSMCADAIAALAFATPVCGQVEARHRRQDQCVWRPWAESGGSHRACGDLACGWRLPSERRSGRSGCDGRCASPPRGRPGCRAGRAARRSRGSRRPRSGRSAALRPGSAAAAISAKTVSEEAPPAAASHQRSPLSGGSRGAPAVERSRRRGRRRG